MNLIRSLRFTYHSQHRRSFIVKSLALSPLRLMSTTTSALAAGVANSPVSNRPSHPFDLSSLPSSSWMTEMSTTPSTSPPRRFARFVGSIQISPNDSRHYRLITLQNGLKALLVSDSTTDKAAAALSINIGHLSDPDDLPGLAHYCEHLLFLGTEPFPHEAEYKEYLSGSNGSSNAYTSMDETLYHFDCATSALPGALRRHSQFFTTPLFAEDCSEREVKAVDSEFRRNLQLDSRRLFQLGKATSLRGGLEGAKPVYWKFGTGSKETLWDEVEARGEKTRDRLLKWYEGMYSANLMSLVVCGNQSLDELQEMVLKEYSDVPNLNSERNVFDAPTLAEEQLKTLVSYRTIKDTPQLRIEFPMVDLRANWASKPSSFLSHNVGHEGPGSILSELKRRGWATSLSAGGGNGAAGFDFFRINVGLTAIGLEHYDEVLGLVIEYLSILRSTPPQRWAFDEMRRLGEIGWRWKETGQPTSLVKNLASRLSTTLYPFEKILSGPWYATEFDEQTFKACADHLTIENCRVFIGSKAPIEGREWNETERYYGTEYRIDKLNVERLLSLSQPSGKLALPGPNRFIPDNLELVAKTPSPEPVNRPSLIRQTSRGRVFHKKDDRWCIPRACVYFLLKSPIADASPAEAMKTQVLTQLVEEALAEYSYDATLAGLAFSVGTDPQGIEIVLSGYSDKLPLLLEVVLKKVKDLGVEQRMFDLVQERLMKAYKNARLENPSTLADSRLRWLTRETYWTFDQRLEALRVITPDQVQAHIQPLLKDVQIEALVHGNLTTDDATSLMSLVESTLFASSSSEILQPEEEYHRALVLPSPCNIIHRTTVPSQENVNSAASVYYQVGRAPDEKLEAQLMLFSQIAKVPVFSTLRTKEQLGYIVSSSSWSLYGVKGFRVIVQSERSAEYLDERIEALWSTFGGYLEEMKEEDFEKQKESVVKRRLERVKNLGQEAGRYWGEIDQGTLDFFRREREAQLVASLTRSDMLEFLHTHIAPTAPSRRKLSVLMKSQRLQHASLEDLEEVLLRSTSETEKEKIPGLMRSKPTIEQLRRGVESMFPHSQLPKEVEEGLRKVSEWPMLTGEGVEDLRDESIDAFRMSLAKADKPGPMEDYKSDLNVVSHL